MSPSPCRTPTACICSSMRGSSGKATRSASPKRWEAAISDPANRRGGREQKPVKGRHCEEASPTKQSRATGTSLAPLDCLAATKIEARSKRPLSQLCASPHLTLALSAPRGGEGGTRVAGG